MAAPVRVGVVLPARNEAEHIAATMDSLLAQELAGELRLVLVDDNSQDATATLAHAFAEKDSRLRVVQGQPLKARWTGKMWAVAQGLAQPEVLDAEYVLLTDADIVHGREHLNALLTHAQQNDLDLVSEMVHLRCHTFAERATLPAFVFFFRCSTPFGL